jgi:low affinity Fe/Cu permease
MVQREPVMPSEVSEEISRFDRFAAAASRFSSRAYFFAACVLLVVLWAPTYFLFGSVDTWQLLINTATTIITFLMVALIQNTQTRADQAVQHKLNAIADALADLMEHLDESTDTRDLMLDRSELKKAVGLESRESTTHNAAQAQTRESAVSR